MDLAVGDTLLYERELRVGSRADVASVTDQLWPTRRASSGRIDDPSARLHVDREDGAPVTAGTTGARRQLRIPDSPRRLPPARRRPRRPRARARLLGGGSRGRAGTAGDGSGEPGAPAPGTCHAPRGPGVGSHAEPAPGRRSARIQRRGEAGPDCAGRERGIHGRHPGGSRRDRARGGSLPGLRDPGTGVRDPAREHLRGTRRGPSPGDRGARAGARPRPGGSRPIFTSTRSAATTPRCPCAARIDTLLAQGLDVVVSTDHDQLVDYGPLIRSLGLADRVASVVGVEITSSAREAAVPYTAGHLNAFPLSLEPLAYRDGAPPGEGVRVRQIVREHPRPRGRASGTDESPESPGSRR